MLTNGLARRSEVLVCFGFVIDGGVGGSSRWLLVVAGDGGGDCGW